MNNPSMVPMVSSNSLIVEFRGNRLNEGEISSIYFGHIESSMRSMISEINVLSAASFSKMRLVCCCCLLFGCFPCLIICTLPKLNAAWKRDLQNIINKYQQIMESNGFTCDFVQIIDRKIQKTYLEFKKKT